MPYSDPESREWVRSAVKQMSETPHRVLDIGAGVGIWESSLRPILPRARFTAVEVFEPYVQKFFLRDLYESVIIEDARDIELPEADLVVMGDVLEHMPVHDAVDLWGRALAAAPAVVATIPLGEHQQGVAMWNHDDVLSRLLNITRYEVMKIVGVYLGGPGWSDS